MKAVILRASKVVTGVIAALAVLAVVYYEAWVVSMAIPWLWHNAEDVVIILSDGSREAMLADKLLYTVLPTAILIFLPLILVGLSDIVGAWVFDQD